MRSRDVAGEDDAAHRPALQDDRRVRKSAYPAERSKIVLLAGGNVDFLLRADDQVAIGKHLLQVLRHPVGADVAVLARRMTGKAPEVRAIVDVESHPSPRGARDADRLLQRGRRTGLREMRAGHDDGAGRADEVGVDVGLGQAHVRAILAIEEKREGAVILDRQDGERGEPLPVDLDAIKRHALAGKLLADEAAELLVADPGDEPGLQPKPRRADRDIGRRAPDRLREARHILQARADLLPVEVDGRAPEGDDVEGRDRIIRVALSHCPRLLAVGLTPANSLS